MSVKTLANEVDATGGAPDQQPQSQQNQQQKPKEAAPPEYKLEDCDRFSFDDSNCFEEDSLCSWSSEPESLCNNWRGWKKPIISSTFGGYSKKGPEDQVATLTELAARCVASFIPFELVEHVFPPVPEQLQLRIAFWSFPDNEEDIRLYSCLANSSADEFHRGDLLYKNRAVKEPLQIGFHLSATVISLQPRTQFNVAVTFDRRRISSCNCTCTSAAYWCSHVVAVCLHRIHCPNEVTLRAPVSESLTRLQRDQLQKFAQYLISELPQQILPTAQRLLDELLSSQPTAINTVCGAPDPTAGASANDLTNWYLDEKTLHDNIKKILIKFCLPAPMVFSDVNYLTNSAPPAAAEWSSLLRPLRGREPEGMWNLLSIVREMYRRCDRNAVRLLEIITEECMACDQILVWWFNTKLSLLIGTTGHNGGKHSNTHSNSNASQHACSSLCDEIVILWRLAALNPGLAPEERDMLHAQFTSWHLKILDRVAKSRVGNTSHSNKQQQNLRTDAELFIGFKPAIEACYLDWEDYPIPGITHTQDTNPMYHSPFTCFKHTDSKSEVNIHVNSSQVTLSNSVKLYQPQHAGHHTMKNRQYRDYVSSSNNSNSSSDSVNVCLNNVANINNDREDGNRSSTSSEGFCENDDDGADSGNNAIVEKSISSSNLTNMKVKTNVKKVIKTFHVNENCVGSDDISNLSSSSSNDSLRRTGNSSNFNLNNELKLQEQHPHTPLSSPSYSSVSSSKQEILNITKSANSENKNFDFENIDVSGQIGVLEAGLEEENNSSASSSPKVLVNKNNELPSDLRNSKLLSRRISKDGSISSSESKLSLEEYNMYFCEGKPILTNVPPQIDLESQIDIEQSLSLPGVSSSIVAQSQHPSYQNYQSFYHQQQQHFLHSSNYPFNHPYFQSYKPNECKSPIFSNLRPTEDAWDILFARAEGLHAHGHGREACILAVRLAEELLANPPNLMIELPPPPKRKGKKQNINPISHQLTVLASATLAKCAFLCTVLAENSEHYHLAFQICLFGLELPRPPASTKPLEVKLANQEADLLALLKRIPLGLMELKVIRDRAENLRDGTIKSRGEALLPIMLASFIFDALVMPSVTGKDNRTKVMSIAFRFPNDENLGFEAAVAALGLKANVSEAEHPLLCEGTRRQRGDLALTLLYYYKDESRKIAKIMEKLLDREIHILIKSPLHHAYYSTNPPVRTANSHRRDDLEMTVQYHNDPLQNDYNGCNSRPHSSTSAELENSINTLSISSQNNTPTASTSSQMISGGAVTSTRVKDRFKGKRAYPSIPNQPSEASAHFMFELAKNVLTKAGGTSSTSLFTQASTNQNHHGPHRALHMCAFQLGLYALGLHNCVSPNWLSRTYSSHVSWIIGQAMEIGAPAISFLIDTWEGHLTPPEAAGMADRASRGWDSNMVYPAAELALSVLPHAAALNPNEIQRAVLQCKEQSDQMLERACITVESAAKGGGVYPEVLFQIARYWYELYIRNTPGGDMDHEPNDTHLDHNVTLPPLMESPDVPLTNCPPPPMQNQQVVVTTAPPQPFQQAVVAAPIGITHYGPYSFACQGIYPHHHNIPFPHNQMQMYISAPQQFPYPPPSNGQQPPPPNYGQPVGAPFHPITHPPVAQGYPQMQCANGQQYSGIPVQVPVPPPNNGQMQPNLQYYNTQVSMPSQPPNNMRNQPSHHGGAYPFVPTPPVRRHPHQFSPIQLRYLLAAYNVGMLAMETLARRVHDDRPQAKYARNPPYGEDVKWLLRISKKLGTQYLHQFCVCAVNSIVSPFVLHDVAIDSAHYLARNNPTLVMQHLRSALTPLVQKCQQMYIQCIHQKLYHLTTADYEDFASIILAARAAFQITPEGNAQFKDWLQSIRRSKSCKKDLWTQINAALQTTSK